MKLVLGALVVVAAIAHVGKWRSNMLGASKNWI